MSYVAGPTILLYFPSAGFLLVTVVPHLFGPAFWTYRRLRIRETLRPELSCQSSIPGWNQDCLPAGGADPRSGRRAGATNTLPVGLSTALRVKLSLDRLRRCFTPAEKRCTW